MLSAPLYASAGFTDALVNGGNPFQQAAEGFAAGNPFGPGDPAHQYTYSKVLGDAGWQPTSLFGHITEFGFQRSTLKEFLIKRMQKLLVALIERLAFLHEFLNGLDALIEELLPRLVRCSLPVSDHFSDVLIHVSMTC